MANKLYQLLFKRTSTYALSIAVGAFIFERTFDTTCEAIFDNMNKGKLWKHIKHQYEE